MSDITLSEDLVKQLINQAVEKMIVNIVEQLENDDAWIKKVELMATQAMVQRAVAGLSSLDIGNMVRQQVVENIRQQQTEIKGIQNLADQCELTVMNGHVVVENNFATKSLSVIDDARVKNLTVTGVINTDNESWNELKDSVATKTLNALTEKWQEKLVDDVRNTIQKQGINFDSITVNGSALISGNELSAGIKHSRLRTLGRLESLSVDGPADINDTVHVVSKRLGVNTAEPEMALGIWDEEVSVLAGKHKSQTAYIGTGRNQNLCLGVNRETQVEIDINGLTTVKKLRVGVHHISHANELPGWAGIKGDVVFNADPTVGNNVFAWQCLGGHRWKVIRSVE